MLSVARQGVPSVRRFRCGAVSRFVFFLVTSLSTVVLAADSCDADTPFLMGFGPQANADALRTFSDIRLKPIGRVDLRVKTSGTLKQRGRSGDFSVDIRGYSVFSSYQKWIKRDDYIKEIDFALKVSNGKERAITMSWNGALLAETLLDDHAQPYKFSFKFGSLPEPDKTTSTGDKGFGDDGLSVGQMAYMAWQQCDNIRIVLPASQIVVGQSLLPTSPLQAKEFAFQNLIIPAFRGFADRDVTSDEKRQVMEGLSIDKWNNQAVIRGVTRKDGVDYIDYGGQFSGKMKIIEQDYSFDGDVRVLIDPFSGVVRTYGFDGNADFETEDGQAWSMIVRTSLETFVEQKVMTPVPQPQNPTVAFKPTWPSNNQKLPYLPAASGKASVLSTADLYDQAIKSVATVKSKTGFGSGFYIAQGVLVTNAHVIGDERTFEIVDRSGKRQGVLVKLDRQADIAFVSTGATVAPLPLATDLPRTGEQALIIGAPSGLDGTLTGGLVSSIRTSDGIKYVQTDAPINPGNSGGPVIDAAGRVIGMATFKLIDDDIGLEGLSFAVSALEIRKRFSN